MLLRRSAFSCETCDVDDHNTAALSDFPETDMHLLLSGMEQAPFAALLFLPDAGLTLTWRNEAHALMTDTVGVDVIGQPMFEAFPPSEDLEGTAAMDAIRTSVIEMVTTGASTDIGPYRYDLRAPGGGFVEHHWRIRMSPVVSAGRVAAILQVAQDVTQEVLATKLSETLQRAAATTTAVSYFNYDPQTDHFIRTATVDEMFGFAAGEAGDLAAPFFDRIHPEDLPGVHAEVARVLCAPRGEVAAFDYRVPQADGTERFLRIRAEMAIDPADRREKLVGTFVDLTDVEMHRRQLQRELALREALVSEANHRIKNSLAIALAVLRMEKQVLLKENHDHSSSTVAALTALEGRIGAISSVHGLMQLDGNRTDVSLRSLIDELVRKVHASSGVPPEDVQLTLTGPDRLLDSDMAATLGMILNELMTNALKYGMSAEGRAEITVTAEITPEEARIEVTNRIETEAPIDAITSSRLGSMLVQQLASDYDATVEAGPRGEIYVTRLCLPA